MTRDPPDRGRTESFSAQVGGRHQVQRQPLRARLCSGAPNLLALPENGIPGEGPIISYYSIIYYTYVLYVYF